MSQSKLFLLIVILVAIGVVGFIINYTKQSSPGIQPIKLSIKEEITVSEKGEKVEAVKIVEIKKIRDEIKTEVEGSIIKYRGESFYSEDDFLAILKNEEGFKSQLIEKFKQSLIGVSAENFDFSLNQSKKSAVLKCNIKGAKYGTNSYDMHFLLGNWPFDLMDFQRFEKKLTYQGKMNDVPTSVVFEFPYTLGHCHEHVWPK